MLNLDASGYDNMDGMGRGGAWPIDYHRS